MGREAMGGRSRQLLWVLLLVLLVTAAAVGCGGGGGTDTDSTIAPPVTNPGSSGGGDSEGLIDVQVVPPKGERIADETIATTDETPTEFVDALVAATPIVLLFYVAGGADDTAVMESLDRLEPSFNRYEFLRYDYSLPDKYGDLSTLLGVTYPPELILLDRSGIIRKVWTGYVDEGSLNQTLVNLGRE